MKSAKLAILALSILVTQASAASAGSASGSAALALAAVVAQYSPALKPAEKKAVASLFAGNANYAATGKISVTADKLMCRTSNVDLTSRSCELTFKSGKRSLKGREANELFATAALAGIPAEGAAEPSGDDHHYPGPDADLTAAIDSGGPTPWPPSPWRWRGSRVVGSSLSIAMGRGGGGAFSQIPR